MNALSGGLLVILLLVVCLAPRRWAVLAIMTGVFFLTQGHSVDVFGLNMYPVRFLEAFAFARVVLRGELTWSRLNKIDAILLLLYNYAALIGILRSSQVSAYQFAAAMDPTLCYLALRGLIASLEDMQQMLVGLVALLVPFTGLVLLERITGTSSFTLVGAAPELLFRKGVPRAQGSFRHAILLGTVAATFLPLYIALWRAAVHRKAAMLGGSLCLVLVVLSNSGGPFTSAAAALMGWAAWPLRRRLHLVRRAAIGAFLLLLVFMKAPIWYLPFKVSSLIGGGGFHRGLLMERAWQDFGRWWLTGIDSKDTRDWIPYTLDAVGGVDVTNQFLVFALNGGLAALLLCIALFLIAFYQLGFALRAVRDAVPNGVQRELVLWGIGVALFVHGVSWIGVSYFDQSWVVWLTHASLISMAVDAKTLRVLGGMAVPAIEPDGPPRPLPEPAWRRRPAHRVAHRSVISTRSLPVSNVHRRADG